LGAALLSEKEYSFFGMEFQDQQIASLLVKRDEAAFELVFKTHYKNLYAYAFTILKDEDEAEETVQQVFFKLWERSEQLSIPGSVAAYLYRAVHNESLNFLKHQKVKEGYRLHVAYSMKNKSEQPQGRMIKKELEEKFRETLNELPEQCRTVFQLSRFEDMKYRDIAGKLDISVKTVENHMGKALKILRTKLVDFLPLLFILFKL
jgi:RNA polymerase sigma-70 factor (ECF subfamily)